MDFTKYGKIKVLRNLRVDNKILLSIEEIVIKPINLN